MKSVDWLDVYVRHGGERVRAGVLAAFYSAPESPAPPVEAEGGGGEGEGGWDGEELPTEGGGGGRNKRVDLRLMPADPLERARRLLQERFAPSKRKDARLGGWPLRRWDENWYLHDGVKYAKLSDEGMGARLRPWLSSFQTMITVTEEVLSEDGKKEKVKTRVPVPFVPKDAMVGELAHYLQSDTMIEAQEVPCWIQEELSRDGRPVFRTLGDEPEFSRGRVLSEEGVIAAGLPDPMRVLVFPNGLVYLDEFFAGTYTLHPHTERFFTLSCLAVDFPIEELKAIGDDEEAFDEVTGRMCPVWNEFLEISSEGDSKWKDLAMQIGGVCLTHLTEYEVVPVIQGQSRSGKTTFVHGAIRTLVGKDNYGTGGIKEATKDFFWYTQMGKTVCVFPDTDTGKQQDTVAAAENVKRVSGQDPFFADRKHEEGINALWLTAKIVFTCNRMVHLPDPSGALANRFKVLHFPLGFAGKEDRRFKDPEVIKREERGRMLWALWGLKKLRRLGKFVQPAVGEEVLDEYRDYSDPLRGFAEECIAREDVETPIKEIFDTWRAYCGQSGRDAHSHGWFCMQLRMACPWIRRRLVRDEGTRHYVYRGIKIVHRPDSAATKTMW